MDNRHSYISTFQQMVETFCRFLECLKEGFNTLHNSHPEENTLDVVNQIMNKVENGTQISIFKLKGKNESKEIGVKESLGIDRKGKTHTASVTPDMKQKENKEIKRRYYHHRFDDVMQLLIEDHGDEFKPFPEINSEEIVPIHLISRISRA